jgi:CPA1 family monovalent cation:H+ antiporter
VRSVQIILFLVGLATVVATFARRVSVPAPSLLVVAGVLVGLLPGVPQIQVTPEIVSLVVLPPLLYVAGEELSWRDLRAVWRPVGVLAVGLVLASAAAVGAVAAWVAPLSVGQAFLLGAVLASTDPVAVTALGRRLSLPPRLQTLVQAESLFNDATSLILFRIAVGFVVAGGALRWTEIAGQFLLLAGGGAAIGAAVAIGVAAVRRRTDDPVVETVVALITPYLAYVVAEPLHTSGVTAVVVASVLLGVLAPRLANPRSRLQLDAVFGTVVFLLESIVFSLIGLELPGLVRRLSSVDERWPLAAIAIATTLIVVRIAWVFPLAAIQHRRGARRAKVPGRRRDASSEPAPSFWRAWQAPAVLSWAGTRGVVPLAAALSIPLNDAAGHPVPQRDLLLVLATAVIVISLVVQGFTLAPLVRRAGLAVPQADTHDEYLRARLRIAEAGAAHVEQLAEMEAVAPVVIERVRRSLNTRLEMARERAEKVDEPAPRGEDADGVGEASPAPVAESNGIGDAYRRVRRDLLAVQSEELDRLYAQGTITDATRRRIQRQLDLEDARFTDDR